MDVDEACEWLLELKRSHEAYLKEKIARGLGHRDTERKRIAALNVALKAVYDLKKQRDQPQASCTYQVEYQDDNDTTHVTEYGERLSAAMSCARRKSKVHTVAYVVACTPDDRVGHKMFGEGYLIETDGKGF